MDSSWSSGGDDRWKMSRKGRSRSGRPHAMDASSGSAGSSVLSRSYSASVSSSRSSATASGSTAAAATSGSSSSSAAPSSSQQQHQQQQQQASGGAAEASSSSRLSKKCVEAVKEHRARFYIVRRCVSMLVCWREY